MRVGEVQNADTVRGRCHTAILAFTTSLKKAAFNRHISVFIHRYEEKVSKLRYR